MNGEINLWNFGLLFSSISFLLGIIGIVVSRHGTDRSIASGLILQGVLLTFVVGGTYSQQSREMKIGRAHV